MPYFPLVSVTFRRCPVTYGYAVLRSWFECAPVGKNTIDVRSAGEKKRHIASPSRRQQNQSPTSKPKQRLSKTMLSGHGGVKTYPLFVPGEQNQI
jgi:hypothetical protein